VCATLNMGTWPPDPRNSAGVYFGGPIPVDETLHLFDSDRGTPGMDSFQIYAVLEWGKPMDLSNIILVLFSLCGIIAVGLAVLLIYRATLSSKEDDQIFIDASEHHYVEEQQELIAKMSRLRMPIIALTAMVTVLFISGIGVWLYQGFTRSGFAP
jgi:hypothetical protein